MPLGVTGSFGPHIHSDCCVARAAVLLWSPGSLCCLTNGLLALPSRSVGVKTSMALAAHMSPADPVLGGARIFCP